MSLNKNDEILNIKTAVSDVESEAKINIKKPIIKNLIILAALLMVIFHIYTPDSALPK